MHNLMNSVAIFLFNLNVSTRDIVGYHYISPTICDVRCSSFLSRERDISKLRFGNFLAFSLCWSEVYTTKFLPVNERTNGLPSVLHRFITDSILKIISYLGKFSIFTTCLTPLTSSSKCEVGRFN